MCYQTAARAEDTAEEIRALRAQLKKLEAKVNAQARMQKESHVQIRTVESRPAPTPVQIPSGIALGPLVGAPQTGLTATQSDIRGLPVAGSPSLYINGVSITPGGFFELAGVFRDRFIGADIATPWQAIPFYNSRTGLANEFRMSARQSRANLLVKGDVNPSTHLAAFIELDFLGAAQTANSNESNSYTPRIRHLYATLDQDDLGAHVLAGQTWSLITMNSKGIVPRQENIPLQIDAGYVPGFVWTRTPEIRFVKDFDKTFWAGVSVESPATTFGCAPTGSPLAIGCTPAGPYVAGLPTTGPAALLPGSLVYNVAPPGGSLFNSANTYSLNHLPDVAGKLAWDSSLEGHNIHLEGFGLFRDFYSQVNNSNQDVAGWGAGGSMLVSLLPKQLELQFSGMTGRGIGRYGSAQLSDVAFNWNGAISPLQQTMLFAGLTFHPTPDLDMYVYAGQEAQQASTSTITLGTGKTIAVSAYGYGNPLYTNAGCSIIGSAVCNGNIHLIRQLTGGIWDNLYSGPFGKVRVGLQYSFTQKYSFPGFGGSAKTEDSIGLFSIRYYPFDAPPPPAPVIAKY
ncbi:hypothetical protein [Methylocapsa palsarum]|nr:hypothetical protein [Methylocapsa palsarum]